MILLKVIPYILFALFLSLFHEIGHYISAIILNLKVDCVGFSFKPVPRFFVSIIDSGISLKDRIIFYLSGSISIFLLFAILLFWGFWHTYYYYIIVVQIVVDTNPFYSDYVLAISNLKYKSGIRKLFLKEKNPNIAIYLSNKIKNEYFYSMTWYIHVLVWGGTNNTSFV